MGKSKEGRSPDESKFAYVKRLSRTLASKSFDFNKILEFFEKHSKNLPFIQAVSQKANVSPGVLLLLMCFIVFLLVLSRLGGSLICDAVGFLYPSYKSYKVLKFSEDYSKSRDGTSGAREHGDQSESRSLEATPENLENNRHQLVYWTKYWVVFSLGFMFSYFANMFLYWLPFFYLAKLIFIVLLLHPKLQGAELIYNYLISPILNKYETTIDNAVVSIEATADQLITKYGVEKLSGRLKEYATRQVSK